MKRLIIFLLIICNLAFNGCFSYQDINRLMFPMLVLVDIDKDNNPVVYLETFRPFRGAQASSEKGQRIIFKGEGKTVYECLRDVSLSSSLKFNFSQNKVLVFTQQAAEYGLNEFIDVFDRYHEFVIRPYIAVTLTGPEELFKAKIKEEEFLGVYLKQLLDNEGASTRAVQVDIHNYLVKRLMGERTVVVPAIKVKEEQIDQVITVNGGAILKEDKMRAVLPPTDGLGFNLMMRRLDTGSLEVTNPDFGDRFVSLEILRSHPKTEISYDGKVVRMKKTISITTSMVEVQKGLELSQEKYTTLQENSVRNIKKACNRVFEKYKDANLDIFEVQEEFKRRYPQEKIDNVLKITELELEVNEKLIGSPDTQDFWN